MSLKFLVRDNEVVITNERVELVIIDRKKKDIVFDDFFFEESDIFPNLFKLMNWKVRFFPLPRYY